MPTTMTTNIKNNDFKDVVFNRQSVRQFDPTVKIEREELQTIIDETISAPSACNLQSWHFVVADSADGKAKAKSVLMPFNYPQIDSCSAMILSWAIRNRIWSIGTCGIKLVKKDALPRKSGIKSSRRSYQCMKMRVQNFYKLMR
ncbi:Nitroreductase [Lactiplantibacillus plantarum subsp. plantarum]|nr:Nitroreductase [Lactiplantibacillus plantarum subsp. plantarum]